MQLGYGALIPAPKRRLLLRQVSLHKLVQEVTMSPLTFRMEATIPKLTTNPHLWPISGYTKEKDLFRHSQFQSNMVSLRKNHNHPSPDACPVPNLLVVLGCVDPQEEYEDAHQQQEHPERRLPPEQLNSRDTAQTISIKQVQV